MRKYVNSIFDTDIGVLVPEDTEVRRSVSISEFTVFRRWGERPVSSEADARAELAILEEMQLGLFYFDKPDRSGGRPSEVFRLASYGDSDNTSTDGIAA